MATTPHKQNVATINGVKAGKVVAGSFSGTPLTASVAFDEPMSDANYSVILTSEVDLASAAFAPVSLNYSEAGFDISLTVALATNLVAVRWVVVGHTQ